MLPVLPASSNSAMYASNRDDEFGLRLLKRLPRLWMQERHGEKGAGRKRLFFYKAPRPRPAKGGLGRWPAYIFIRDCSCPTFSSDARDCARSFTSALVSSGFSMQSSRDIEFRILVMSAKESKARPSQRRIGCNWRKKCK